MGCEPVTGVDGLCCRRKYERQKLLGIFRMRCGFQSADVIVDSVPLIEFRARLNLIDRQTEVTWRDGFRSPRPARRPPFGR